MPQKQRVKNVLDRDFRGWVPVIDSKGKEFEIFYSTQIETKQNSKYFTILEGFNKNKVVTINHKSLPHRLYSEYLGSMKISESCFLVLDLARSEILFKKDEKMMQVMIQANNLTPGEYLILNPDRRHTDKIVKDYISETNGGSRFAETWFPLFKNEFEFKYLHYGSFSNGCATVLSGSDWTDIYLYVISSRMKGLEDNVHGRLLVVEDLSEVSAGSDSNS